MPYALRFDGVNDVVSIPSGMTGNVGTSTYSFRIKSGPAGITLPASGLAGFIGTTQATTSNGLIVNSTGQIRVYSAGTNRYGSTAQLIFSGVPFDYTLTHVNAGGAWDIYNNLTNSPTGESGNFTTSVTWAAGSNSLNQFGRSSSNNTVFLQGDIASIEVTGLVNAQDWEADLSGGAGTTLPTVSGTNQGTLTDFDVPACWIFYSTGASWEGTIGKTSLTVSNTQLFTALGYQTIVGLLDIFTTGKQQNVSAGYSNVLNKITDNLSNKQLVSQTGSVLNLVRYTEDISYKQLDVQAGTTVSFTGLLNKQNYPVTYKQLSTSLGWSSGGGVTKQSLSVAGKQESANLGYSSLLQKLIITLNSKPLSVQVGAAIPFIGLLNRLQLNAVGKPLSVSAGTSIPFLGLIDKTSLLLSGKVLDASRGQYIDIVPSHLTLITKLLSIGEVVYPVIPKRRVYGLNDKIRLYIMRR